MRIARAAVLLACLTALVGCSSSTSGPDSGLELPGTIVFASDRDGDYEIFRMDADGGGLQKLTENLSLIHI